MTKPSTLQTLQPGSKHMIAGLEMTFTHWTPEGHPSFQKVYNGYSTHWVDKKLNSNSPLSALK